MPEIGAPQGCPNCGADVSAKLSFCPYCGARLSLASGASTVDVVISILFVVLVLATLGFGFLGTCGLLLSGDWGGAEQARRLLLIAAGTLVGAVTLVLWRRRQAGGWGVVAPVVGDVLLGIVIAYLSLSALWGVIAVVRSLVGSSPDGQVALAILVSIGFQIGIAALMVRWLRRRLMSRRTGGK